MSGEYRKKIAERHMRAAEETGFEMAGCSEYAPWIFDRDNSVLVLAEEAYRKVSGKEPESGASHVGLEPSVLGELNDDMEMVSIGMEIHDPHSVHERVELHTVGKFSAMLRYIIERYAEMHR